MSSITATQVQTKQSQPKLTKSSYQRAPRFKDIKNGTTLKRGQQGPTVRSLQDMLGVTVDGKFGPKTAGAVRQFQNKSGLLATGQVDQATLQALRNSAQNRVGPSDSRETTLELQKRAAQKKLTGANQKVTIQTKTQSAGQLSFLAQKQQSKNNNITKSPSARPANADPLKAGMCIKKSLSRGLTDWAITDSDVKNVHNNLGSLSKGDYKRQINRMAKNGQLNKYLGNMDNQARGNFLEQAKQKGYVQQEKSHPADSKQLNPPAKPGLFYNDGTLPKPMRQTIHKHNLHLAKKYDSDFEKYNKRFIGGVKKTKTPEQLRQLGRPATPGTLTQPGITVGHPDYRRLSSDWNRRSPNISNHHCYRAINDQVYRFRGKRRPGTFHVNVSGKVGLTAVAGGPKTSYKASITGSSDGLVKSGHKVTNSQKAGPVTVSVNPNSKKLSDNSVSLELGRFGTKFGSNGDREASLGVGTRGSVKGSVYAKGNHKQGTFEGGLKLKLGKENNPFDAELSIGAGMKTISPKEVLSALNSVGFFPSAATQKLWSAGVSWDQIPRGYQQRLKDQAWTKQEWNKHIK